MSHVIRSLALDMTSCSFCPPLENPKIVLCIHEVDLAKVCCVHWSIEFAKTISDVERKIFRLLVQDCVTPDDKY